MQFFIEDDIGFIWSIAFEGGERSVADDTQKPGPAVLAAKAFEKSERAQRGFLDDVFGVLVAAHNEAGQIVSGIEMRQNLPLELGQASGLGQSEHVSLLSLIKNKTANV